MLFNSIHFVFFLPLVVILYYLIPHKFRWALLLVASYSFYMVWKAEYVFLILTSTVINYFAALEMEKHSEKSQKRFFLGISLAANIGLLGIFKYFNFFSKSFQWLTDQFSMGHDWPALELLLPVGLSFYTFQTLSYSIDVYRGKQKAEKHFGYFAVYVSFFPQLLAGPIERFSSLAPQFRAKHDLKYSNIVNGLRLILYGLFIKMVIADNLAVYVDKVYNGINDFGSLDILISWFFYSFQIYSDFYGYSIIAIGSALMLGIRIIDNFNTPYLSRGISEFWKRWHISLSTWFRDYVYFPLGGDKNSKISWIINILIVFLVIGLWHGANWTFVFWGGILAFFYLIEKMFIGKVNSDKLSGFSFLEILRVVITFIIVTMAWVFFRSQHIADAFDMFRLLFTNDNALFTLDVKPVIWLLLIIFLISDVLLYNTRFDRAIGKLPFSIRWLCYGFMIFAIIVFAAVEHIPFIYFQF